MVQQDDPLAVEKQCRQMIETCLARYDWALLDREEFARQVQIRLATNATLLPRQIVFQVYTLALHGACSGNQGSARQERGYTELFAFLGAHAVRRYPAIHLDVTQRALEAIYRTFDHCRQPESFLAFAAQKLRDAGRTELRLAHHDDSLDAESEQDDRRDVQWSLAAQATDPLVHALAADLRHRLMQCVRAFLQRHPRATQQFAVLWMKYIEGLDDRAISARLGTSVASIHVLRSRAIAKLRDDPDWQLLARDLGLGNRLTLADAA